MKLQQAAGDVRRQARPSVVTAGTGPVGLRAAGLLAKAGADVVITSRKREQDERARDGLRQRFGGTVRRRHACRTPPQAARRARRRRHCSSTPVRPACMLVPRDAWAGRRGPAVAADLNAVPPLGVEGIEANDDGVDA